MIRPSYNAGAKIQALLTSCLEKLRLDIPCTCGDFRALWNLFFLFFLPSSKGEFILCFSPSYFFFFLPLYLCLSPFSPWSWSLGRPGCSYFELTKAVPLEFVLWVPVVERFQEDPGLPSTGTGATREFHKDAWGLGCFHSGMVHH